MYKTIYSFLIYLLCLNSVSAQTSIQPIIGTYQWTRSILMRPLDRFGNVDVSQPRLETLIGQKFKVISLNGDNVTIRILDYSNNPILKAKYNFNFDYKKASLIYMLTGNFPDMRTISLGNTTIPASNTTITSERLPVEYAYFQVSVADLQQHAISIDRVKGSFTIGILNFPFKFRPQYDENNKNDFNASFNFGTALGIRFGHKKSKKALYSLLVGYSVSSVLLDSVSVMRNAPDLRKVNNFTALSISLGGMLEYERAQIGIFIGNDNLGRANQDTFGWKYHGKPWFSIGFAYTLFTNDKPKTDGAEQKNDAP